MALAIECGATNSVAVFVSEDQIEIEFEKTIRYHFGPANFKLLKPIELEKFFINIYNTVEQRDEVTALAVAMPGVLNDTDKKVHAHIRVIRFIYNFARYFPFHRLGTEKCSLEDLVQLGEANLGGQRCRVLTRASPHQGLPHSQCGHLWHWLLLLRHRWGAFQKDWRLRARDW